VDLLLFQIELFAKRPVSFSIDLVGLLHQLLARRLDGDEAQTLLGDELVGLGLDVLPLDTRPLSPHLVLLDQLGCGLAVFRGIAVQMLLYRIQRCCGEFGPSLGSVRFG